MLPIAVLADFSIKYAAASNIFNLNSFAADVLLKFMVSFN